jgi:asparagine synthase (glutamine-hydrolysing)
VFRREYVDRLLEAPDQHLTPLKGSKLWQVAVLELWMQTHGV